RRVDPELAREVSSEHVLDRRGASIDLDAEQVAPDDGNHPPVAYEQHELVPIEIVIHGAPPQEVGRRMHAEYDNAPRALFPPAPFPWVRHRVSGSRALATRGGPRGLGGVS